MGRGVITILFSMFFATLLPAAQRTFVSAAAGNDANPCTRTMPCRNFAAALPQTDPNGEVVVLDSGGYGTVTITQAVSIISPAGIYAGITGFSGDAITVDAGNTAHVVLRNLQLNSQGAEDGIDALTVGALYVESCVINNFSSEGILFFPGTSGARLHVSNTVIRRCYTGIQMGGTATRAIINSVRLYENFQGFRLDNAVATIRDSVAAGGGDTGFSASGSSKLWIEDSVATRNAFGFWASGSSVMTMTRCTATSNTYGIYASFDTPLILASDSTVMANGTGVHRVGSAEIVSRSNNTLQSNATNGMFTTGFGAN